MIDFTELPIDGIRFEQLIRELLVLEGFETRWTGVGQDGGRDLIVIEYLKGELSESKRTWLVSCKHLANSGRSLGRDLAGNITEDCKAIGAEGYILVCSTQPTSSLVTRLNEIAISQNIITRFWDSIEIENRLTKPNTFKLIHTFFPESSKNFRWQIYNTFSPAFWAANYKDYFLYMSCRHSNKFPYLKNVEAIASIIEQVPIYKDHYLRLRAVYYDDKHCTHIGYFDYIYPKNTSKESILNPVELNNNLLDAFNNGNYEDLNTPEWDVVFKEEFTNSDSFELDHKKYYEPFLEKFETGMERVNFLHNLVYKYKELRGYE